MERFKTNRQPLRRFHQFNNRRQMLQPMPQATPLPGRYLKTRDDRRFGNASVNQIQRRRDTNQAGLFARAQLVV